MPATQVEQLIGLISKFPSLGPRSARRIVLHLLKKKEGLMIPFMNLLKDVSENMTVCPICGNMDVSKPCSICSDEKRNHQLLCVVQDVADLWALERSGAYKGVYHILGGVLSALDGIGPDELRIDSLLNRIATEQVKEVILALPATLDGQTTVHYLTDKIPSGIKVSALSQGVPMGGELDYLDDGTLQMAFASRRILEQEV